MWAKIIRVIVKKNVCDVLIYFDEDTEPENKAAVNIKTMCNEWHLQERIVFENRDAAYDHIKEFSDQMAKDFVNRTAYQLNALDKENKG